MKTTIAVCFIGLVAFALARPGDDHYTDKYDNVNVDEILENDTLLKSFVYCMLEKGKCSPDGKELQTHMADALQTKCAKCTDKQKEGTKKVIRHLVNKEPGYWKELCDKFDPEGTYLKEYEKEFKEITA